MSRLPRESLPTQRGDPRQYVVKIFGRTKQDSPQPNEQYHGTGFLLNSKGHVATCWHVVEHAAIIFVRVPADPEQYVYDLLVERPTEDVAVLTPHLWSGLKIPPATLHCDWFEEDRVGDAVAVWGYSSDSATAQAHLTPCHIRGGWGRYGLIMLDGNLYEGDSGGPVINENEHVIGILSAVDPKHESHAMARPISRLCKLLTDEKHKQIDFHIAVGGGQLAGQAIDLLLELLANPAVRAAVQASLGIFEEASRQISILYAYKKVHDLLHEVEFGCYNSMVSDVRYFPDQEAAVANISIYIYRLSKYLSSAEDIVREASERSERIAKVYEQLNKAYEALQDAERAREVTHYRRSIQLLRLLLSRAQSTFNLLLNQAARELRIDALVAAMQSVQQGIARAELPLDTASKFQLGVNDLAALGRDLHTRTAEHDRWQQVDDVLRGVESNSPSLLSDLDSFWPLIMSELKAVCELAKPTPPSVVDARTPDWRARLAQEMTNLEDALTRGEPTRARRHFESLYQQAADRLDRIDKKLLQICDKISKVRDPLRTLVGAVK